MNSDERRSARATVMLAAVIEHSDTRTPVRVRDLSEHGAQVIGDELPAPDTQIIFRCNGKAVAGWVAWSQGERCGIEFGKPTAPDLLTKREPRPDAITRDTREADFRRPGFRGNLLSEEERRIIEQWTKSSRK